MELDLTKGGCVRVITLYSIPIIIGNVFQQCYQLVDSIIVGRNVSYQALAGLGASNGLVFFIIGFVLGITSGMGICMAQAFGKGDYDRLRRSLATSLVICAATTLLLTLAGVVLCGPVLRWMGTPADVMPNSILYFRVLFLGIIGNLMYNILQGVHQAIGDSTHPLYYLIISSVTNIILDVLFVGVMGFSVGAAALATIISQFLSSILSLTHLLRGPEEYRVRLKEIRIDKELMKEVI